MDRPLNIVHCVESYAPALGGMPEVVKQLSERMVRMGHHVTVFTKAHPDRKSDRLNGVDIRGFQLSGNHVDGIVGDTVPYLQALRESKADIITFFAAQQWASDIALPHLGSLPGKKVFVPTGFSALHDPRWAGYYGQMPRWLGDMDLNLFLSHHYQDIEFAKAHAITNHTVIPNGAAEEEFDRTPEFDLRSSLGIEPAQPLVMHLGSYTGIKGHREAIQLFVKARTGRSVLALIGNGNVALERIYQRHFSYFLLRLSALLKRKRIVFLELDRARTVDALKQADLFLFPSNVECSPIVLFEAMAAGVPFLSSRAGNAAEIVAWSNGGWTMPGHRDAQQRERPDIAAGARMLEEILHDPAKRKEAAQAGHQAWRERFTWRHIAGQYISAYKHLVSGDQQ
ncbi:MAG: glycosyltransferase family 4 protein [Flavobacteriales bacterium]|nr:glycosyltransferase family 4 protein [Flavobacteriales bacterium]